MTKIKRDFIAGKMNKVVDERLLPDGQYVDAMNVRMGSTENSEIGVIENTKGNKALTSLLYIDGTPLSTKARTIGALDDSQNETIYWFVHDPQFLLPGSPPTKLDLIVSYNVFTGVLVYHVISINDPYNPGNTTLNFSPAYLITGVNKIGDLLFFTDDYNPPRFINVKRSYPVPVGNVDQFSAESILVIKKFPLNSPIVTPANTVGQENFMEDRFLCFAYRYRYADGEYSATSQWSEPCFIPRPFALDLTSFLNDGMQNQNNQANIQYYSGDELVKGIDLLFKQMGGNVINVIEKIDKQIAGIPDGVNVTYNFDNSKVLTVLPESELLRLYDNVPKKAKAQTIMGNRLMYGNYLEGYDLIDKNGQPTRIDYQATLVSEGIGTTTIPSYTSNGQPYSFGGNAYTITGSQINIDLTNILSQNNNKIPAGSAINVSFTFMGATTGGGSGNGWYSPSGANYPTSHTSQTDLSFSIFTNGEYNSVFDLASSVEFQEAIGTLTSILPIYGPSPTSSDGNTFTDSFNSTALSSHIPATPPPNGVYKYWSGYSDIGGVMPDPSASPTAIQPSPVSYTTSGNLISIQLPAMGYVDSNLSVLPPAAPTYYLVEFYSVVAVQADFYTIAQTKSLHSNRGYEIGIVYMDEFGRSTNVLTSVNNNVHVPCDSSENKNGITVTIPTTQIAPSWASRYKFVCRADRENYETIYSFIYYNDLVEDNCYLLLEGENTRKVEEGDRLIVKADTNGSLPNCVYTTVLEKKSWEKDSLPNIPVSPAGVYMKLKPQNFSTIVQYTGPTPDFIDLGTITTEENNGGDIPIQTYPVTFGGNDIEIPAGSVITLSFYFERKGAGCACEKRVYTLLLNVRASRNYTSFYNFWMGENIGGLVDTGVGETSCGASLPNNVFNPGPNSSPSPGPNSGTNYYWFESNGQVLKLSGTVRCTGTGLDNGKRRSLIRTQIIIKKAEKALVFETLPSETIPDIFFENERSYPIDQNGNHLSNPIYSGDQSQDIALGTPAIIKTNFYNCYTFGNGVESYKILDSLIGRTINLGNRVNSVSSKDYKEVRRNSDVTYSGIYNEESNVNKLNEFNLGLLNYKNLEVSFGSIYILDGRQTDMLVLQEDKISAVLVEKNLLSDSTGGGAIASIPEVLGTQVARPEKYGISFNPESYVQWGYDRFFTDVKRGAVIQLRGDSYQNDQLNVISELGMRTWFRDTFIGSFNKQKLGGFDPYMNEYVLSGNDIELPEQVECVACGLTQTFTLSNYTGKYMLKSYCVNLLQPTGPVTINYNVTVLNTQAPVFIYAKYDGVFYPFPPPAINSTGPGTISFIKSSSTINTVDIYISYPEGTTVVSIFPECPIPEELNIIEVVYTKQPDAGKQIHTEYYYYNPTYTGALQSNQVTFSNVMSNPLVSRYNSITGFVGNPGFPMAGDTMRLRTNKINPDTFDFNTSVHKFMYLRSNTLYQNNPVDMQALRTAAINASPISGGAPIYYADFTVPASSNGAYLYLIWDLRDSGNDEPYPLCYTASTGEESIICCDCTPCRYECVSLQMQNTSSANTASIYFPSGLCENPYVAVTIDLDPGEVVSLFCVVNDNNWSVTSGDISISVDGCACVSPCTSDCQTYTIQTIKGSGNCTVEFIDCFTNLPSSAVLSDNYWYDLCVAKTTVPDVVSGTAIPILTQDCGCCATQPCWDVTISNTDTIGVVSVQYYDCEGNFQAFLLNPGQQNEICVSKPYPSPEIIASAGTRYTVSINDSCSCDRVINP